MKIKTHFKNIEATDSILNYVTEKLNKIENHFDVNTNVYVKFEVEKHLQKVEIFYHLKGKDFKVEDVSNDLYASIDNVVDKVDRQIIAYKEKKQNHKIESPKRMSI